jgi:energy-coupling factor transporter ATP-binding protein EcfA2
MEKTSADIVMKLKNYKLIKDFDKTYENARILLVTGKNEVGKSSLIRGLIENMTAKSTTPQPVTIGEKDGAKSFTIPDKNGNPVTIVNNFSEKNPKGSFYAIDYMGRKIKSVDDIRELIGVFQEMSIDKFYNLQSTAEGRRKIIKQMYSLLSPEDQQRIEHIDKETNKGGSTFDQRTAINAEIKALENIIKESIPTNEEEILAQEYVNINVNLEKLRSDYQQANIKVSSQTALKDRLKEYQDEYDKLPALHEKMKADTQQKTDANAKQIEYYREQIELLGNENKALVEDLNKSTNELRQKAKDIKSKISEIEKNVGDTDVDIVELTKSIQEAEAIKERSAGARAKHAEYIKNLERIKAARQKEEEFTAEIQSLRSQKEDIIANSNLPSGLVIDGDTFTWNDFVFDDNQISKSSALLVIAEILCNIVESRIVYIGEKALFDKDRFKQLVKIAQKYGKIPVLEEVIDNQVEIKVITEIEDEETEH